MPDTSTLLWGVLFGSIGVGYFMYGKKQKRTMPFLAGIGLMAFPYVVSGTLATVLVGTVLLILPFIIKI